MSAPAESSPIAIAASESPERRRAFTVKAIATGLFGGLGIGWITNFNRNVLQGPDLIGNHLPIGPLALIMLLGLAWNPTVGRWLKPLRFNPREMTVVLTLMLMCCWMPTSGFFRYFHRLVARPIIEEPARPAWRVQHTVERIPEHLFPLHGSAERHTQIQALAVLGEGDAAVRGVLDALDPVVLDAQAPAADIAARALETTRERLAQLALADSSWQPAKELVDRLPALIPLDPDASAYAVAFRGLRERYLEQLPAARKEAERVYGGFVQSLSVGDRQVAMSELPWAAWARPMAYWAPMVLMFMACIVAMTLVVHRQWSRHEQLSYPLATITTALVERSEGRLVPDILGQRLFWWGFVPVLALHMLNYAAVWFPANVPKVDLGWGFGGELRALFPVLNNVGDPGVTGGRISFLLIGIAYFISSEMSLSMGLSSILLLLLNVQIFVATGGSADQDSARAGGYFAYAAILLYAGRSYYWAVALKAIGVRKVEDADREPVWGARLLVASAIGFIAVLSTLFAMDWFVATLFTGTVLVMFLVFTRIICETGSPFMQTGWYPSTVLFSTLGFSALGSLPLVMVCYLTPFLAQDPREGLMPYVATSMKMAENTGVRRFPLAWLGFGAMAIALVVCFVAWTKSIYQDGSGSDNWANSVPAVHLDAASRGLAVLADTGQQATADATHGLAKLGQVSFGGHAREVTWFIVGAILVASFSVARFSFTWWPLHPVLFLVWGTYPAQCSWPSFLLGWAIKILVVRFAGGRVYTQLRPLFIGVVLGEIFAIAVVLVMGYIVYLVTGTVPKSYWVLFG